jgi:hypothetical protein
MMMTMNKNKKMRRSHFRRMMITAINPTWRTIVKQTSRSEWMLLLVHEPVPITYDHEEKEVMIIYMQHMR